MNYAITFQSGQSIWARQLDLESLTETDFTCDGCILWILGYKTESLPAVAVTVLLENGARLKYLLSFCIHSRQPPLPPIP